MKKDLGQIALGILLIMVVLLTVGLAVVSRSVTDIRISKETEESARAFSVAEAGIEEMLKREVLTPGTEPISVGDLTAQVTVAMTNSFETRIEGSETAQVNLKDYSGDIEVSWSGKGLELTLIYKDGGDWKIKRDAFTLSGTSCESLPSELSPVTFNVPNSDSGTEKVLRVRPLCSEAEVKVTGSNPLPDQSYTIRSSTTIPESGQTRVVEVTRSLPILPPIFDYVLFSGGELAK